MSPPNRDIQISTFSKSDRILPILNSRWLPSPSLFSPDKRLSSQSPSRHQPSPRPSLSVSTARTPFQHPQAHPPLSPLPPPPAVDPAKASLSAQSSAPSSALACSSFSSGGVAIMGSKSVSSRRAAPLPPLTPPDREGRARCRSLSPRSRRRR